MTPAATWSEEIAAFSLDTFTSPVPPDALERAALQLFDSFACAAGAHEAPPVTSARRVIAGSAPREGTVAFTGSMASAVDAVLANGTAVRYLDANDVYLGRLGPGGHPSDNIVVALAVAERAGATGREFLRAVVVAYELVWRLRNHVLRPLPQGRAWDAVSLSGPVSAVVTGLLLDASPEVLAHAVSIAAVKGYVLREIRGGEISMLKAAGNAVVAREGVLAALLALAGMTGPPHAFEGDRGLVTTLGGQPGQGMLDKVCAPPEWAIRNISIKPFPAFGTSQAAIHAAALLAGDDGFDASDLTEVRVRVPDSEWTRARKEVSGDWWPETRESADHSLSFLVSVALLHGTVLPEHYDRELWRDEEVRSVMARTTILPDERLSEEATTAFPAVVSVRLTGGRALEQEVMDPPGSPGSPYGWDDIARKFQRFDTVGLSSGHITELGEAIAVLERAPDVAAVTALLGDPGAAGSAA